MRMAAVERLGEEDLAMTSCGIPLLDGEDMIAVIFKLCVAQGFSPIAYRV